MGRLLGDTSMARFAGALAGLARLTPALLNILFEEVDPRFASVVSGMHHCMVVRAETGKEGNG